MAKQSIEIEVNAFYRGIVLCPVCHLDVEFEIPAEYKKNDIECMNCEEVFEIKVKEI